MGLIAHVTIKRLVVLALMISFLLIVPVTSGGFQGTSASMLLNQGLGAYDDLFHVLPENTLNVVNGKGTATSMPFASSIDLKVFREDRVFGDPRGYKWQIFDRPIKNTVCVNNGDATCITFDSTEELKAYLGDKISQRLTALREP